MKEPLSTFLPPAVIEAHPLSYNWQRVENSIVFAAEGTRQELTAWYQKRCTGTTRLDDQSDPEYEPGKTDLVITTPKGTEIEMYAIDATYAERKGWANFYSCENLDALRKKYRTKILGILIENR